MLLSVYVSRLQFFDFLRNAFLTIDFELIAVSFSLRCSTCCHSLVSRNPPCLISCCCSTSSIRMQSIKVSQTCIFRWLWALLPQPLLRYTASIPLHRMNAVLWFETFVSVLQTKFRSQRRGMDARCTQVLEIVLQDICFEARFQPSSGTSPAHCNCRRTRR